ncbi:MAG TPA: ABC transporter substrate-binding protein [Pseudolysinimonas sp.]
MVGSILLLSGCTSTGGGADDIILVNGSEPANPLTPGDTDEPGGFRILQALYAGLVAYDEFGVAVPDVAQSITPNEDNTVYTVKLRDGEDFTDGEPVTADSFVDAWDWIALASNKALNQRYFSDIVGFSADADASLITEGGLVVIDDRTFEIHLATPISDFPQRLGLPVFSPLPPAFFDDPSAFAEHPIGNGPYLIDGDDAWKHGNRIELVANPGYHGQRKAQNGGVTMLFYDTLDTAYSDLLSGHLDVLDQLPESALATFEDELSDRDIDGPGPTLESITIPSTLPHFAGPEGTLRRLAISMAFDRTAIVTDLFGVTRIAARDFATPALVGFRGEVPGFGALLYNEDLAKDAWERANLLAPWDGTFEIAYDSDGAQRDWVDTVAASISATLGIDAAGKPYPSDAALQSAIDAGSVGSAYAGVIRGDYPSVTAFIGRYASDSPENTGQYKNLDFDALLGTAAKATTRSDREAAYTRAQSTLLADLPALPLWNSTVQVGFGEGIEHVTIDWHGIPQYEAITKSGG